MIQTAEWVSPNHPDKVCDYISDSILDACLAEDPLSRVAIEVQAGHGTIFITGELTTNAKMDPVEVARGALNMRGIDDSQVSIFQNIEKQSTDIARGVDIGGAGDQGIMVGYACKDTPDQLPIEYSLAKGLGQYIYQKYGSNKDLKTQVSVDVDYSFEKGTEPLYTVKSVLVSAEGFETNEQIEQDIVEFFSQRGVATNDMAIYINPCGQWEGGFNTDAWVTGRKIVVDQYGPRVPVGGGAFSGKDPTKVDRSAAYMARKVAKEILAQTAHCHQVIVKVSYAIGLDYPLSLTIAAYHMGGITRELEPTPELIERFKPANIIAELDLRRPIYAKTVLTGAYGDNDNTWEQL